MRVNYDAAAARFPARAWTFYWLFCQAINVEETHTARLLPASMSTLYAIASVTKSHLPVASTSFKVVKTELKYEMRDATVAHGPQ